MSRPRNKDTVGPTGSLGRLDVGEGNTIGSDGVPVDVALVGRDVDALGLSPLLEMLSRSDGGGEGGGGEEKCRCEILEVEQHRCCRRPPSTASHFIPRRSIGA